MAVGTMNRVTKPNMTPKSMGMYLVTALPLQNPGNLPYRTDPRNRRSCPAASLAAPSTPSRSRPSSQPASSPDLRL